MEKFTKEQLTEQANKFMDAYAIDSFLATEDGNFFHPNDHGLAKDHNAKNVKGELIEFKKEVEAPEPTAEERKAAILVAVKEMEALNITNVKEVKGRLKKAGFDTTLVEEVLNEMSTHE